MGWRRDELWFDIDVLWFREQAGGLFALNAPAFADLPADVPLTIPNGLAASRQRRAVLQARRHAKRTRAAAFLLGSAAMLSLAAPKFGSASRIGEVLAEDPPSQTFRPEVREAPVPRPVARPAVDKRPSEPKRQRRAAAAEKPFPKVHWREATSHGLQYSGWLSEGTQLPLEGPNWLTWNPVSDSIPNAPRRLFGHQRTIHRIVSVLAAYRAEHPDARRVLIGDISFRGGGPMELHASHQNGLDVDVYYPRIDGKLRPPHTTEQIDRRLSQDLLDRFIAAGAKMVFVGFSTHLRGPDGVVIPYPNHENHMHVRFRVPSS